MKYLKIVIVMVFFSLAVASMTSCVSTRCNSNDYFSSGFCK